MVVGPKAFRNYSMPHLNVPFHKRKVSLGHVKTKNQHLANLNMKGFRDGARKTCAPLAVAVVMDSIAMESIAQLGVNYRSVL